MFEKKGKGYIGKSMSVNASIAHSNNEMPISHWTKSKILEVIKELIESEDLILNYNMNLLNKLTAKQLKDTFLECTSWHHTGTFYNATNFYTLNTNWLTSTTEADIESLIETHKKYLQETKEERTKQAQLREVRRNEKEFEKYVKSFQKISKYKTENGLWKAYQNGRIKLEELEELKKELIEQRKIELRKSWTLDKSAQHMLELLDNDDFIYNQYI